MTPMLRALSIASLATALLSVSSSQLAYADGRADWTGYAWQSIKLAECTSSGTTVTCPLYHEKWDWKRNQWVDILVTLDLARGRLNLTQRLTNNDPLDDDYVCVTAVAVDSAGRDIIAHHQNWHSNPRTSDQRDFTYRSSALTRIATIHIGSKQCRDGANQDDALYARVLAGIAS